MAKFLGIKTCSSILGIKLSYIAILVGIANAFIGGCELRNYLNEYIVDMIKADWFVFAVYMITFLTGVFEIYAGLKKKSKFAERALLGEGILLLLALIVLVRLLMQDNSLAVKLTSYWDVYGRKTLYFLFHFLGMYIMFSFHHKVK